MDLVMIFLMIHLKVKICIYRVMFTIYGTLNKGHGVYATLPYHVFRHAMRVLWCLRDFGTRCITC